MRAISLLGLPFTPLTSISIFGWSLSKVPSIFFGVKVHAGILDTSNLDNIKQCVPRFLSCFFNRYQSVGINIISTFFNINDGIFTHMLFLELLLKLFGIKFLSKPRDIFKR